MYYIPWNFIKTRGIGADFGPNPSMIKLYFPMIKCSLHVLVIIPLVSCHSQTLLLVTIPNVSHNTKDVNILEILLLATIHLTLSTRMILELLL